MNARAVPRARRLGTTRSRISVVAGVLVVVLTVAASFAQVGLSADASGRSAQRFAVIAGRDRAEPPMSTATLGVSVRELVGQRLVVAMAGTTPSVALLARIRKGEVGGVILFGGNIESRSQLARTVALMQRAARSAGRPPLLVATDQEGGRIRRLPWAGPIASTTELGRLGPARVRAEAFAAGSQLRAAGVNVNLAPVADLPTRRSFMALEQRTFAATVGGVSAASIAFGSGLAAAGIAGAIKHFPGIGRATRNTDRTAVSIRATASMLEASDLVPFRRAVAAGTPIVMISNASYPALDSKPAPWSARIQVLLRKGLGFRGVTITDALEGAAATRGRPVPSVASAAARAGIDLLLLTGSEAASAAAYERVVQAAESGQISAEDLGASYMRILRLKKMYA